MKTLLLLACGLLALASSASAVIFGVDAFDYPDGPVAGQTGGVSWDRTNAQFFSPSGGPSNWDDVSNAPTVLLGRLVTNNSSAKREYKGSPEADGAVNDGTFAKAVYYRTTVTTGPTLPDFFGMSSYDFGTERIFFGKRFGAPNFALINSITGAFNDSSIPVQPNTTYVLVTRVDYAADTIRLYVNPDLTAAEPASASASLPWTHTEWSTAVRLASGNAGSPVTWDDITVATSWSDLALVVNSAPDVDHGALGGTQSLRDCLKYGAKGSTILFAPALSGATISLGSEIAVTSTSLVGDFIVDASALTNGITIDDGAATTYRLLNVNSGARLEVRGATFANAGAPSGSIDGGAILNSGTLTLTRCALSGNSAGGGHGGAVYSGGTLKVNQCTLSGNSAAFGGGIDSGNDTRLVHTTVANNTAAFGGGINNSSGTTTLLHCTIAENSAANQGGGIASVGESFIHTLMQNSIVAGNAGGDVDFVAGTGVNSFSSFGFNLIGTGNAASTFNSTGDITNNFDPLLEPLGSYGGRTQTMPPLAGSPAIDAAPGVANLDADQRGFARSRDGNNDSTAIPDIGAAEATFRFVTSDLDSGADTLRQALADAAATPGWEAIAFVQSLDGGVISLTSEQAFASALVVSDTAGVSLDASSLGSGLTLTKPLAGDYRLLLVNNNTRLSLHHLTLTGGSISGGLGGAIFNADGTLLLTRCTLSGNSADQGGAIYSNTPTTAGTTLRQCTLTQNTASSGRGGAIRNDNGLTTVAHCTISGNVAPTDNGGGVAADHEAADGKTVVQHSIIAGNTGRDVVTGTFEAIESRGGNVIGSGFGLAAFSQPGDIVIGNADPLLSQLGNHGGPTQTMPPRVGSTAIDRAVALAGFGADQRGRARNSDGNADGITAPDSGAAEAGIVAVTNDQDAGAGSLRQAIADAAALPGPDTILFSQSLDGGTISLTTDSDPGTALVVNDPAALTIDASTLLHGLTITKPAGDYRLFYVTGGMLAMDSLTLTGGNAGGGGAMINTGTTTLTRCTLTENIGTDFAGAVFNAGTFILDRCTVSGNAGVNGGGLCNIATMTVINSTVADNSSSVAGGAIFNLGALTLRHATITGNQAANDAGGVSNGGVLTLGNTIIAGNYLAVPTSRSDLRGNGAFITQGGNLLGENFSVSATFPGGLPNVNDDFAGTATAPLDPRLLPLGKYNGPTPTMPPLAGSRAIDAGINFGLDTIDQRGLDRFADGNNDGNARPDSGAVEAAFRFVTNTHDSDPGSLRQTLAAAAAAPGWEAIAFDPQSLNGGTLSLTTFASATALEVNDAGGVSIDASGLPAGFTITKPAGDYRLFSLDNFKHLSLHGLTLTGGGSPAISGGAIFNFNGDLLLTDCTLSGNTASVGGAIVHGGGIGPNSTTLLRCTISGNSATTRGGGLLAQSGLVVLTHCTISGNNAPLNEAGGIGTTFSFPKVANSIIAGNTGGDV